MRVVGSYVRAGEVKCYVHCLATPSATAAQHLVFILGVVCVSSKFVMIIPYIFKMLQHMVSELSTHFIAVLFLTVHIKKKLSTH